MKTFRVGAAMIALLSISGPAWAQYENPTIQHGSVIKIGEAVKKNLHDGGIHLAARAMVGCYTTFLSNPAAMRACTVWDLALMRLDHSMREMFTGMGVQPGPPPPELTPEAFQARRDTFWKIAFPGGDAQAEVYIGNAPNEVIDIATAK